MIKGVHAMFYAPNADELRAFIRDKLALPFTDVGGGWLVFDTEGEVGCHPAENLRQGISFYCDNIERTMAEMKGRGVEFTTDISDAGFGLTATFRMPGGIDVELYEPKYDKASSRN